MIGIIWYHNMKKYIEQSKGYLPQRQEVEYKCQIEESEKHFPRDHLCDK